MRNWHFRFAPLNVGPRVPTRGADRTLEDPADLADQANGHRLPRRRAKQPCVAEAAIDFDFYEQNQWRF
ncbi:MAG TPA: hypothetical protein VH414_19765 [Lichenihabitans sp.]|jgi:hypothetical protein|nr:hypothetical protein [Lichenihabitans sp.]